MNPEKAKRILDNLQIFTRQRIQQYEREMERHVGLNEFHEASLFMVRIVELKDQLGALEAYGEMFNFLDNKEE